MLNLTGKDYGPNTEALEADLTSDLLINTMKVKYDELPPKIPNTDQASDEWLAHMRLRVTTSNFCTICMSRVSVP